MYKLSKQQLSNSAYYCAAGIDLQPLLRFSDIIDDFIYVSVDIKKETLINGITKSIKNLNEEIGDFLSLESCENFKLSEIEHPKQDKYLNWKPSYLTDRQFREYMDAFLPLAKKCEHYYIHFKIKRKIGNNEKLLNLYYITGEALASYDALYVQQKIAPKIFISIQTGVIEIPEQFSDKMFREHDQKPLIWLRGVWGSDFENYSVFKNYGIFNKEIGMFTNWDSGLGVKIEDVTNPEKNVNTVMAYGQSINWSNDFQKETKKAEFIEINKLLQPYNGSYDTDYTIGARDSRQTNFWSENEKIRKYIDDKSVRKISPALLLQEYLHIIYLEYEYFANQPDTSEFRRSLIPMGYESEEIYIDEFLKNFASINNVKLILDIYYNNPLDYTRQVN